jgi:hypothetical protein
MKTQIIQATSSPHAMPAETNTRRFTVFNDGIDATEVQERLDWKALRDMITVDTSILEFMPTGQHQVAALANLGAALVQEVEAYRPGFVWKSSPAEIVGALIEEMVPPATAVAPAQPVAERASTGPTDCDMIDFLELTGSVQWDLENCTIRFDVPDDLMSGSVREILKAAIVAHWEKA